MAGLPRVRGIQCAGVTDVDCADFDCAEGAACIARAAATTVACRSGRQRQQLAVPAAGHPHDCRASWRSTSAVNETSRSRHSHHLTSSHIASNWNNDAVTQW